LPDACGQRDAFAQCDVDVAFSRAATYALIEHLNLHRLLTTC